MDAESRLEFTDVAKKDKISKIVRLIYKSPEEYDFFLAMYFAEKYWAKNDELSEGSSRKIKVVPDENLSFPAGELKEFDIKSVPNKLMIKTKLLGLYGVNSPLPNYILESALGMERFDNDGVGEASGKRVRDFLDIFNHRIYCLMYSGWKKCQALVEGRGRQDYRALKKAVSGEKLTPDSAAIHYGLNGHRVESASALSLMLSRMLPDLQCSVDDTVSHWVDVDDKQALGRMNIGLGQGVALGTSMLVVGGKIAINIGPMNSSQCAELLPGKERSNSLRDLLESYVKPSIDYDIRMKVKAEKTDVQTLRAGHLQLGENTWLGENPEVVKTICLSRKQLTRQNTRYEDENFAKISYN